MRPTTTSHKRLTRVVERVPDGAESIEAVAEALALSVVDRPLNMVLGLLVAPDRIVLRQGLSQAERSFVLGHEIAHTLIARGECPWVAPGTEEAFCDRFALELINSLPA